MHQLPLVSSTEISARIHRLQENLQQLQTDGALITQNVDLYYFTGTMQNGFLYVPAVGEPCLYVKKSIERAEMESSVPVEALGRLSEWGARLLKRFGEIDTIGIEADVVPYALGEKVKKWFPGVKLIDVSLTIRRIRAVKSDYEWQQIARAAEIVNEVILQLPQWLKVGMSELELVAQIEYALRMKGNFSLYRMRAYNQELALGMVASGSAAATPTYFDGPAGGIGLATANPQGASVKKIELNEPILVDISTVVEGYIVDQTRMAVVGELSAELLQAYELARQILRKVEQVGRPGVPCQQLYVLAQELVNEHGLQDHFMGFGKDQAKFLGHGVGLELDELPILAKGFEYPLEEGMVIAIEPKFTFPGIGVIGIENTYRVGNEGLQAITVSTENVIQVFP